MASSHALQHIRTPLLLLLLLLPLRLQQDHELGLIPCCSLICWHVGTRFENGLHLVLLFGMCAG
jgi:hypothetical protein